jgi:parallel beta-helix repeat protein
MRKLLGLGLVAALAAATLLALSAAPALGNHVRCGDTITQDTTLDSDLIDCPGDGIVVGADGITLDLNGHTVDGIPGQSGTAVDNSAGYDGVRVERGTLRQFGRALSLADVSDNIVKNVVMSDTYGIEAYRIKRSRIEHSVLRPSGGIFISSSEGNYVTDTVVSSSGHEGISLVWSDHNVDRSNSLIGGSPGIEIFESHYSSVVENSVTGGDEGMRLDGATHNRIERNRISDVPSYAMHIVNEGGGSNENRIANNVLVDTQFGVFVAQSDDNVFEGNLVSDTSYAGMVIAFSHGTVLRRNLVRNNLLAGVAIDGDYVVGGPPSSGTRIDHNQLQANGLDGVVIGEGVTKTVLVGNHSPKNGDDGIDVDSADTALRRNTANRNTDLGIEAVEGLVDGGGNRAFGNGNPLQCLNISCQ